MKPSGEIEARLRALRARLGSAFGASVLEIQDEIRRAKDRLREARRAELLAREEKK